MDTTLDRARDQNNLMADSETPRGVTKLGDAIRVRRVERGYSQYRLAQETGVAQTTISMIEIGESGGNAETRKILADALGFDVIDLYRLTGEIP